MRIAAVVLSALGGLIGLRFTAPVVPSMFGGGLGSDVRFAPLLIVGLIASLIALAGAVLALRRSPLAWRLLAVAAIGMLIGLGWFFFIGILPAVLLSVAAWLAYRISRSPKAQA